MSDGRLPVYTRRVEELRINVDPAAPRGVHLLRLEGPFTLRDIFDFQSLVRRVEIPLTIVDFTGVPYMDSAALGSVMGLHAFCQRKHQKYALTGCNDRLQTLFGVCGVDRTLILYPDVEAALQALATDIARADAASGSR